MTPDRLPTDWPPYSDLASPESEALFRAGAERAQQFAVAAEALGGDIPRMREMVDELFFRPQREELLARFPVTIERMTIGGVPVDEVVPVDGIAPGNADRVLINLHGGGLGLAAGLGGQQESIPIAALGRIRVLTVDYRMAPENVFPAASEDVAAVFGALLADHAPENIGIYGCSSGGYLTAAALAWFREHGMPRPGAVGVFGEGAVSPTERWGDSRYTSPFLAWKLDPADRTVLTGPAGGVEPYFAGVDPEHPLASPGLHPDVLRWFPPTLLLSGTRDIGLSSVLQLHAALVREEVDARLHVWEGAQHCSYAQSSPLGADVPENREAWTVIIRFFRDHLGRISADAARRPSPPSSE